MLSDLISRLLCKVDRSGECWVWNSWRRRGYGVARVAGKQKFVHRLMYEHFKGAIPLELEIDHICRNHWCVNPTHLEAVTHQANMRRGATCKASPHWRPPSEEVRYEIGKANRGKKHGPRSESWCHAISQGQLGRVHSPATRAKIGAATSISHLGKTHSAETKAKMAAARKRYWEAKKAIA